MDQEGGDSTPPFSPHVDISSVRQIHEALATVIRPEAEIRKPAEEFLRKSETVSVLCSIGLP